jgi:hypothetical protein
MACGLPASDCGIGSTRPMFMKDMTHACIRPHRVRLLERVSADASTLTAAHDCSVVACSRHDYHYGESLRQVSR